MEYIPHLLGTIDGSVAPPQLDLASIDPALLFAGASTSTAAAPPNFADLSQLPPPPPLLQAAGTRASTRLAHAAAAATIAPAALLNHATTTSGQPAAVPMNLDQDVQGADDADQPEGEDDETLYCICKQRDDGSPMVECGGCQDWFHLRCVGLSKRAVDKLATFTCPACTDAAATAAAAIIAKGKAGGKDTKRRFKSPPSDRSSPADSEADSVYEPPPDEPVTAVKRKSQSGESASKRTKTSSSGSPDLKTKRLSSDVSAGGVGTAPAQSSKGRLEELARRRSSSNSTAAAVSGAGHGSSSTNALSSSSDALNLHDPYRDPVRKHCMEQFVAVLTVIFAAGLAAQQQDSAAAAAAAAATGASAGGGGGEEAAVAPATAAKPVSAGRPAVKYAVALENALFKHYPEPIPGKRDRFQAGKAYKDRFRSLIFSLKDKTNTALRKRIVSGDLPAQLLARMSNAELANDAMRQLTERARVESLASSILKKEQGPLRKMTHKGEIEVERGGGDSGGSGGGGSSSSSSRTESKTATSKPSLVKKPAISPAQSSGMRSSSSSSSIGKAGEAAPTAPKKTAPPAPLPTIARKVSSSTSKQAAPADTPTSETGGANPADSPSTRFNFGSLWMGSPTSDPGEGADGADPAGKDAATEEGKTASPTFSAQGGEIDLGDFGVSDDLIDNFLDESSDAAIVAAAAAAEAAKTIAPVKKPTPSAPSGPRARDRARAEGPSRDAPAGPRKGARPPAPRSAVRPGGQSQPTTGANSIRPTPKAVRSTTPPKLPNVPRRADAPPLSSSAAATASSHQPKGGILKASKPSEEKHRSTRVWQGAFTMPEEGTFSGSVRQIGGRPLGSDPRIWPLFFPEAHTTIEGRLPSRMAEDYLVASTMAHRTEVVAFVLERALCLPGLAMAGDDAPLTESANARSFEKVVRYFAGRERYGVLGSDPSARGRIIKDFYIAALPRDMPSLPAWLKGLVPGLDKYEPTLQHPRSGLGSQNEDVFVLAAVLFKGALDAELALSAPPPSIVSQPAIPTPATVPSSYAPVSSTGPADPLAGLLGAGGASALQDLLKSVGVVGPATSQPSSSSVPISSSHSAPPSAAVQPPPTMPVSTASALAQVPTEKLEPLLLANPKLVDQLLASLQEQGRADPVGGASLLPSSTTTSTSGHGANPAAAAAAEKEAYDPGAAGGVIPGFAALVGATPSPVGASGAAVWPPRGGPPYGDAAGAQGGGYGRGH
ncbi:hypothetical protein V8E36_004768 [Tilletia maclaganii]